MELDQNERTVLRAIYTHLQKQKYNKADRALVDSICVELIKPKRFSNKQLISIIFTCTQTLENAVKAGTKEEFEVLEGIITKATNAISLEGLK